MTAAIIGGAIAAVIGALCYAIAGLCLERRREKAQKLAIVDALIIETAENLVTCTSTTTRKMWWMTRFRLETYNAYKGHIFFLPKEVRIQLVQAAFAMEGVNIGKQIHISKVDYGQLVKEKPLSLAPELVKQLKFVNEELQKWKAEHTRSLVFRIRRRLRNFIPKIRKNSKLNHS